METNRRKFIQQLLAVSAAMGLSTTASVQTLANTLAKGRLPQRKLGKTGASVGLYSLGAQATVEQVSMRDQAVEIVNKCIDMGINYIDTAAWYGHDKTGRITEREKLLGTSERHVGEVLKYRRSEVFLATKTHERSYDGSMRLLENSLKNLQTDQIDLWQIHNIKGDEDVDRIFADDGVIKAMEKAKSEGMVKNLGITGHTSPAPMKELIERFPFDNVLMAINAADKFHNSFIENLLPVALEKEMGIVGMKIPARDRIFSKGGIITMDEAMNYVLSLPVSTIIVGLDKISELEENIKIAKEFEPLSADEILEIENKVEPHYKHLQFFKGLSDWPKEWSGNNV